jgi:CheY-like chemotaxis protein
MEQHSESQKAVLIVEDNDLARQTVADLLRREGYQVVEAANGREALTCLRDGPRPDLILLDMLMPVLDGWLFLRRWRREEPKPPVPIVITTGTILTREWATDQGCQGFLRKPFDVEPLFAEIRRCLGEPGQGPDGTLDSGNTMSQ